MRIWLRVANQPFIRFDIGAFHPVFDQSDFDESESMSLMS